MRLPLATVGTSGDEPRVPKIAAPKVPAITAAPVAAPSMPAVPKAPQAPDEGDRQRLSRFRGDLNSLHVRGARAEHAGLRALQEGTRIVLSDPAEEAIRRAGTAAVERFVPSSVTSGLTGAAEDAIGAIPGVGLLARFGIGAAAGISTSYVGSRLANPAIRAGFRATGATPPELGEEKFSWGETVADTLGSAVGGLAGAVGGGGIGSFAAGMAGAYAGGLAARRLYDWFSPFSSSGHAQTALNRFATPIKPGKSA